jgi:hypothetical protein
MLAHSRLIGLGCVKTVLAQQKANPGSLSKQIETTDGAANDVAAAHLTREKLIRVL